MSIQENSYAPISGGPLGGFVAKHVWTQGFQLPLPPFRQRGILINLADGLLRDTKEKSQLSVFLHTEGVLDGAFG